MAKEVAQHQNCAEADHLNNPPKPPTIRGRSLGIIVLTAAQILIGFIHVFFGALLLAFETLTLLSTPIAYEFYTLSYGLMVLFFAVTFWQGKRAGWVGTVIVSLFVIAADVLTLLNLPSIPGIPKLPAFFEITYSLLIIFYLIQPHIKKKYIG
jgi:hypothetical protein